MNVIFRNTPPPTIEDAIHALQPTAVSVPIHIAIYIPDRDKDGQAINQVFWVTTFSQLFAHLFGGVTVSPVHTGMWENEDTGLMVRENTILVMAMVQPCDLHFYAKTIRSHIYKFQHETKQGEVIFRIGKAILSFKNTLAISTISELEHAAQ